MHGHHEPRDRAGPEPRPPAPTGHKRRARPPLPPLGAPFWSPTPILAYRLWWIRNNVVHGARTTWTAPVLDAFCPSRNDGACPHGDGRCGRLGCGIYAIKDPTRVRGWLNLRPARGWVAGLTALSGKVVEHELGYRAARAEAVAVVVATRDRLVAGTATDWIRAVFADPVEACGGDPRAEMLDGGPVDPRSAKRLALDYLQTQHRIMEETWTSESPSG